MKPRWIIIALMISVAFNLTFLGAAGYRLWSKHSRHEERIERFFINRPKMERNLPCRIEPNHMEEMRDRMNPKISSIRKRLFAERRMLSELLMKDKPDTNQINEKIGRIGSLQVEIEKAIIDEMMKEDSSQGAPVRRRIIRVFHERLGDMPDPLMPPPFFDDEDTLLEHRPGR